MCLNADFPVGHTRNENERLVTYTQPFIQKPRVCHVGLLATVAIGTLGSVLGNGEAVGGCLVILDRVVVGTVQQHVTSVVLEVQGVVADVESDETVGGLLGVGTEPLGVGAEGNAVVAVAGLGITSGTGENEVHTLVLVVGHAVIVAVDNDAVVLADDVNQGSQLGVVARRGDVAVVDLQDLPGGVGLSEGLTQEIHLLLGVLVASDNIVGVVDGGGGLVGVNEAVRVHHDKGRGPVRAGQVVGVVGQVVVTKVPPVLHQRSNASLEVDAGAASNNVVVAQRLVPWLAVEGLTNVRIGPALVEALDTLRGEVDTAVIEVVADRDEGRAVLLETDILDIASSASCR